MATTRLKIRRKDKTLGEEVFFKLLDDFISDSSSGKRLKKNGTRISDATVDTYTYFRRVIKLFTDESSDSVALSQTLSKIFYYLPLLVY